MMMQRFTGCNPRDINLEENGECYETVDINEIVEYVVEEYLQQKLTESELAAPDELFNDQEAAAIDLTVDEVDPPVKTKDAIAAMKLVMRYSDKNKFSD